MAHKKLVDIAWRKPLTYTVSTRLVRNMEAAVADEPLNLTVKKMPVAIVAPFSFVDNNQNIKSETNKNDTSSDEDNNKDNDSKKDEDEYVDLPQDLSLNNKNNDFNLEWNKNNNKLNDKNTQQLRNYLCKNETPNLYDKNTFNETLNSKCYQYNNIYSLFDNLNNKIPFWYFFNSESNQFDSSEHYKNKSVDSNSILNNLLDKKPQNVSEFPTDFGSLIKNEMQKKQNETGTFFDG